MNKASPQDDFVGKGFHQLDDKIVHTKNPPKIRWGKKYLDSLPEIKISYLEKLCATMNHAAFLIQNERNQLNDLCVAKEKQINQMKGALDANNAMITTQITTHNEEKQLLQKAVADLKREVRELESGDNN
jgi:hypothetical protein